MNPLAIISTVTSVVGLIRKVLPLIGVNETEIMGGVVKTLTDMAPLVTDQIGATYTGIRNIIDSVGSHPATTGEQLIALRAFSKQVDDAWNAIESQLDPDATKPTS